MKITFLLVGKIKETFYADGIKMYITRLSKYATTEFININESKYSTLTSPSEIARGLEEEGQSILSKINEKEGVILFDTKGKTMDSVEFASNLDKIERSHLFFIVGGSNGVSDIVRKRADMRIKISDFTFTHPLAMLIGCEQVYRAYKILNNEKYHK